MTSTRPDRATTDAVADRSWLGRLLAPRSAPLDRAPRAAIVDPGAAPFAAGDSAYGVLLCHGFTGSPRSMRPWAEYLASHGFRTSVPRLPGHGTSWQEMNLTTWREWYDEVDRGFFELQRECEQVFVAGISMGGCLALRLAEEHGSDVAGLALVNPAVTSADRRLLALPALKFLTASIAGIADDIAKPGVSEGGYPRTPLHALASMIQMWHEVGERLPEVDQPLLIFTSVVDHVVDPSSAKLILDQVASRDVAVRRLERSHHVATLDYDAELIFAESAAFFSRLLPSLPTSTGDATGRGGSGAAGTVGEVASDPDGQS